MNTPDQSTPLYRDAAVVVAEAYYRLRSENESLERRCKRLEAALRALSKLEGSPDIDPLGDIQFGLHCGLEDRDCDRYRASDFGYAQGVDRALEWVMNTATAVLNQKD